MEDQQASKPEQGKDLEVKQVNTELFSNGVEKDKDYYFNSYAHYSTYSVLTWYSGLTPNQIIRVFSHRHT